MKKKLLLVLAITLLLFNCSKDDNKDEETSDFDITSEYYFAAIIDGEKVLFQHGIDGHFNAISSGGCTTPAGVQQEQGMVFMKAFVPKNYGSVILLKSFTDWPSKCSELEQMFHTGSYNFGVGCGMDGKIEKDGVVIQYIDNDGVSWTSDLSPSTQAGNSFKITEYKDFATPTTSKIMKAIFNCTLYDANGNSKELTKGEIRSLCRDCSSF